MKTIKFLALGLVFCTAAAGFAQVNNQKIEIDQTTLLVKMRPGTSGALVDTLVGAREISSIPQIGWRTVRLPRGMTLERAKSLYRANPDVVMVETREKGRLLFTPNDSDYATRQYAPQIMNAPRAWDLTRGASSVIISILDTGIDYNHPDFQNGKLLRGYDFSDNDSDATDDLPFIPYVNHGIHCAGIAAASTNNGIGMAGLGFNSRILPVKVFPNSFADVVSRGIIYSADQGAKVISMSIGFTFRSQMMQDAVNYAWARNALPIAAAGNDNTNNDLIPQYPANLDNVLSVGSTDRRDQKSDFSNFGRTVDVAAPGSDIYSTFSVANGSYGELSGTSMACPAVAGVAGLIYAYAPLGTTNSQIVTALERTATPVGNWVKTGRVDAFRAVNEFTLSNPVTVPLIGATAFQGTQVSGPGSVINVQSMMVRNFGTVSATSLRFRAPAEPYSRLRSSRFTFTGNAINRATTQLFFWNYSTRTWELMATQPSASSMTYNGGIFPARFINTSTREIQAMVRTFVPLRPGNPTGPFVMSMNSASGVFQYTAN